MNRPRILFVDDQKSARDLFARLLDAERYEPLLADGVAAAEAHVRDKEPDVIITDLRMPGLDGLQGLERFHQLDPDVPVILITAFGTVETAVEAMKRGAFDYIRKPFDPSEIEIVIERALEHRNLVRENARLRSELARKDRDNDIIGRSRAMRKVLELTARIAPTDCSVLILGESGTGKDLFAKRIHRLSNRAAKPFVSLNCSAIPEHLLESELFGHEKGAFSGATVARPGFFAEADCGTLFLDEIGDMSTSLQPKLLRVLQDGEFYRVGSRRLSRTDVRLISASNRNIRDLVEDGAFRQDLFYRINTVSVLLPSLRERTDDIPMLAEFFLARVRERGLEGPERFGARTVRALLAYRWPGNVRELEHVVDRAYLVCDSAEIGPDDLPPEVLGTEEVATESGLRGYKDARRDFEHRYFTRLLEATEGNIQKAAELAGIHRSTFYEKLGKLDITVTERP